ncbi:fasciclin domain-containing protein [Flavihumibacter fluvii]|uniref:fasciclin domain-containing protein n=1 Tax=Flavihumibacter fluvii TaxID=2838157 RepID=UPI001BDF5490|nr:fasciclin domain-containing protein [Flavihumibacter fluvii]ULQ54470.1 fasciclin domain-containing protein [Flavihumibacter fluvii]
MKRVILFMVISASVLLGGKAAEAQSADIIEVASGSTVHSTFMAVVKAADLVATLKGVGPFTVFAPTNDAFTKLPPGTLDALVKPENNPVLTKMLIYHVVLGTFDAATINKAIFDGGGKTILPTLSGGKLIATTEGGKIRLTDENGASAYVTAADLKGSNGLIHIIDAVLLPK